MNWLEKLEDENKKRQAFEDVISARSIEFYKNSELFRSLILRVGMATDWNLYTITNAHMQPDHGDIGGYLGFICNCRSGYMLLKPKFSILFYINTSGFPYISLFKLRSQSYGDDIHYDYRHIGEFDFIIYKETEKTIINFFEKLTNCRNCDEIENLLIEFNQRKNHSNFGRIF